MKTKLETLEKQQRQRDKATLSKLFVLGVSLACGTICLFCFQQVFLPFLLTLTKFVFCCVGSLPFKLLLMSGTASDVAGIDSETVLRNTVSESRIVTSEKERRRRREQREERESERDREDRGSRRLWRRYWPPRSLFAISPSI